MTEQQHNDTLTNAIETGINSQGNASISLTGTIGDNYFLADLRDDMDFYRFQGGAGDRIEWKITADGYPWYLADLVFGGVLYNANGNIIQNSSQGSSGTYAFILPTNGLFYLAVWGTPGRPFSGTSADVDPNLFPRSIVNAVNTGAYTLSFNLFDNTPNYPSPPTTLAISSTNATQTEGNSGSKAFTFTVTRSGDTSLASSASFAITGSGTNPANAADFGGALPTGTVNFAAGETTKTITVNVSGDSIFEANETFNVTLSNPTGATIDPVKTIATGTITNDDVAALPSISLAVSPASVQENGTPNLVYTFTRNGATTNALTVNYSVAGTATNTDYTGTTTGTGKTVTFAANSATAIVTVDPTADTEAKRGKRKSNRLLTHFKRR
jgi:hypothetical protein